MGMIAFFGDQKLKNERIARVQKHIDMDELVRGQTGEDGKGCAVWCTLDKYDHKAYETEMGIPEWLARVEDTLFENMSKEKSKTWPKVFLESINPGADLEKVKTPFMILILKKNLETLNSLKVDEKFKDVISAIDQTKKATEQMIHAHETGGDLSAAESAAWSAAESARSAAWSAAESARSAAWSAAESARSAAESAAESAAWSAAESAAESAAWSAAESARSAAWSAAESARSAAWSAAFDYYADQLLEIIRGVGA